MNIENLTREQKAELKRQLEAEEKAEKARVQRERENYKQLVDGWVEDKVKQLQNVSSIMMDAKADIFATAQTIISMKGDLFKVKIDRKSDTLSTSDGTKTIRIGNRINEGWDDTVNVGVDKVKAYLRTLAKDDNSANLVDTVMGLLAKDRKGNLKAQKVLELERLAVKSGNEDFMDGIRIIKDAYRPVPTCQFVEAIVRDENGKEHAIPLSMSAIE
ncbi:DUF3164 family protein [Parabacteroides distasonis]|uniref:DUF3164 family protein n=2 Tax=Parabacteroides distasonis TaxID=823 RepID=UPI00189F9C5E|nr:DUF3164 family protein [Parabacteroides distasonis]MDB9154227.1 DUF3164 family protein [Parabacteroides distasonis]MDB9158735.1 DUF3164 family protein [Parabacteroides distasonis]MDB9167513.1 DUF3164 family protein [Parabacteroides distasonis]MDB9172042.1 DUF3164 family protein [Parabacteroides distasonis]